MARNLQAKLAPSDTIRVFDINTAAAERLAQEMKAQQAGGAAAEVATSAADASREAVCATSCVIPFLPVPSGFYDEFVPNMTSKLGPASCRPYA